MPLFDLIFLGLFIAGWMLTGLVPWMITSVVTRGHAGLLNLPLCLLAAVAGGLLVPIVGFTGSSGIWLSFAIALLFPSGLMAARRLSLGVLSETAAAEPAGERSE